MGCSCEGGESAPSKDEEEEEDADEDGVCTLAAVALAARNWTGKLDAFGSPAASGDGAASAPEAAVVVALSSSFCLK